MKAQENQPKSDYDKAIGCLKGSPMFNLSLSSKELFHSNFLYWIYITNKESFSSLLNVIGIKTEDWGDNWVVRREFLNFDLCVIDTGSNKEKLLAVIENKVKSIPTAEQLAKYNEKIEKNFQNKDISKILLSLTESNIEVDGWKYVSYQPICDKLIEDGFQSTLEDYGRRLVVDYANFVKTLIELTRIWKDDANNEDNIFLLDYKERESKSEEESQESGELKNGASGKNPDKYRKARELRIHDLYGKYRTAILKEKLADRLKSLKSTNLTITPQIAYSNSLPILEVMIKGVGEPEDTSQKKEAEAFFVSIQGNQYRHAINARDDGAATKESRVEASEKKCINFRDWHWFMDPNIRPNNEGNNCFPNSESLLNSGQRKNLCSFAGRGGVNYIYQYKKISPTATVGNILDIVVKDVENVIEKFK